MAMLVVALASEEPDVQRIANTAVSEHTERDNICEQLLGQEGLSCHHCLVSIVRTLISHSPQSCLSAFATA